MPTGTLDEALLGYVRPRLEALHDESVRLKVTKETAVTRSHSFAEAFSALTGGRLGIRYAPDDAAEMIAAARARIAEKVRSQAIEAEVIEDHA